MTLPRFCLTLLLAAFFPLPAVADSFVQGRTVVILEGLPGDLESETTYNGEMTQLLEALNRPGMGVKNVIVLSGATQAPDVKTSFPVEALSNRRETFLGLGDKVKNGPAVFVVFGHGGMQGSTPVFHVPGPRLTPDDFVAVAKNCPASTWLLFFSGSGSFAKALQAPQRNLLATESDDKNFNVDPVSFGLFLGLLKNENDLNRLADQLGAATGRWYDDRKQARTEEPALWVDAQPPRNLVKPSAEPPASIQVADNPPASIQVADNPPAKNPAPPVAPPLPVPDPGPGWEAITPVDPKLYAGADAVTLSRHVSYVIEGDSGVTEDDETFLQILTREGKRFGDFDFAYSPPDEDLTFSACEVRGADGTMDRLDPDAVREAANNMPEDYQVERKKIFSLPHVEPGAILHVHYQRVWKRYPTPRVFEEIPLASDVPTVALKIEIEVPEKTTLHYKIRNLAPAEPTVTKGQYGSTYAWQFHDVAAVVDEPLSPRDLTPALVMTTFPDWASFADWYRRMIVGSNTSSPEIDAQARELASGAKTDRDKIAAVTRFVTNFRYVAVPLGINSYRPHSAVSVFQNRYGDCKDKANLLNTMLATLGYKTSLVLVPRFSQADKDIPGDAFNHAISTVQLGDETLWLDSTDDVCRFGLLPPGDPGRKVLVVNNPANTLSELPQAAAHDNRLMVETMVTLPDASSRESQVEVTCNTAGYADYILRYSAQSGGRSADVQPLLAKPFYLTTGSFEPKVQESTAVADLDPTFFWKAQGVWQGLVSQLPQSSDRLVRLPCWLPREWTVATLPRQNPLYLNEGYPMEVTQSCTFRLPAGATAVKLPEARTLDNPVLSWKLNWTKTSDAEVAAKLELILHKADLTMEETRDFQASCHHLEEALQDGFSFQAK